MKPQNSVFTKGFYCESMLGSNNMKIKDHSKRRVFVNCIREQLTNFCQKMFSDKECFEISIDMKNNSRELFLP